MSQSAPDAQEDPDLAAAAEEEIVRALDLGWRQLSRLVPWGDNYDGFAPSGRMVQFERNYLWADGQGGDILCEVAVYEPAAYERAARRRRIIRG